MVRPEKVQAVGEIKDRISGSTAVFLTEYRGLTVSEQQELRRRLRGTDTDYAVVKMTLARRAVEGLGLAELHPWLVGPTAIAFANGDPVAAARALRDFAGEHQQLVLKGGLLSGLVIPPEQVTKLADVEPRETMLSRFVSAGRSSLVRFAVLASSLPRGAAWMLRQLLEQKEAGSPIEGREEVPGEAAADVPEPASPPSEESPDTPAAEESASATAGDSSEETPEAAAHEGSEDTAPPNTEAEAEGPEATTQEREEE